MLCPNCKPLRMRPTMQMSPYALVRDPAGLLHLLPSHAQQRKLCSLAHRCLWPSLLHKSPCSYGLAQPPTCSSMSPYTLAPDTLSHEVAITSLCSGCCQLAAHASSQLGCPLHHRFQHVPHATCCAPTSCPDIAQAHNKHQSRSPRPACPLALCNFSFTRPTSIPCLFPMRLSNSRQWTGFLLVTPTCITHSTQASARSPPCQ